MVVKYGQQIVEKNTNSNWQKVGFSQKEKLLKKGIYLALIHDEHFKLQVPKKFHARYFN